MARVCFTIRDAKGNKEEGGFEMEVGASLDDGDLVDMISTADSNSSYQTWT